ncbi:MAG: hypothetical protein ACOX27_04905 [Caldicoprobacterales bacterium]
MKIKAKKVNLVCFIIESVADQVKKEIDRGVIRGFSILKTGGGNLKNENESVRGYKRMNYTKTPYLPNIAEQEI